MQHSIHIHLIGNSASHARINLEQSMHSNHEDGLFIKLHMKFSCRYSAETNGGLALLKCEDHARSDTTEPVCGFFANTYWTCGAKIGTGESNVCCKSSG